MDEETDAFDGETDVDRRTKRMAPTRILQVLYRHSDMFHPLTQEEIMAFLERDFGMPIKRKAVGYSVALLRDSGFDIRQAEMARGIYLGSRSFDDDEIRLLEDGVLSGGRLPEAEARGLAERLGVLSNAYYEGIADSVTPVFDRRWDENGDDLLRSVTFLDEAIGEGRRVRFAYNAYGPDKILRKTSERAVSPYGMILSDRRYFLVAYDENDGKMLRFRLDRMTGLKTVREESIPLRSVPGYERGIDYAYEAASLPLPERDEPDEIELLVDADALDDTVERFGDEAEISEAGDGRYRVFAEASPRVTERWAMEHLDGVEVVSPSSLRERIAKNVACAAKRYSSRKR